MSVSITICPEGAVRDGAKWRVLDGNGPGDRWLDSGEVATGLEPRQYQIEFFSVAGWKTLPGCRIRNVKGFTNCKTVSYKASSFYELGKFPPQTVWHDQRLEFTIPIETARVIAVSCEPRPEGELFLNQETGLFHFQPDPADKFPFLVTFADRDGGKKQIFEITPMPILPPEVDVFGGMSDPQ
ncbi:MAG: hypothetical protein H6965_12095 [Chromatiaceae bacterium]|nr:hypothetical protein [Chromatiaceae bacterium]